MSVLPPSVFSHFGINVVDLEKMERFYVNVFGFVTSDRGVRINGQRVVFLTMSAHDHHQLVLLDGREINLTKMELQLLGFFATNVGVGATQAQLLTSVWRSKADIPTNTVRQTVSSLRRKLALDAGSAFELEFSADKRYVFRQVRFDPSPT